MRKDNNLLLSKLDGSDDTAARNSSNHSSHSTTLLKAIFLVLIFAFFYLSLINNPNLRSSEDSNSTVVFEDDFNGDSIDLSVWRIADNTTHNPLELQLYVKDNIRVQDGYLIITTKRDPETCRKYHSPRNFTSGWVETKGTTYYKYGRFEVSAKINSGVKTKNIWPALWLMPEPEYTKPPRLCWPAAGEIDIMEMWGGYNSNAVASSFHWTNSTSRCGAKNDKSTRVAQFPPTGSPPQDLSLDFHTWTLDWTEHMMKFSLDGKEMGRVTSNEVKIPNSPFYWIINTAVCGAPWCHVDGDMQLPSEMFVDYVRISQLRS